MGDAFEARFADAKSTVNQLALDAISKCNAIGPQLKQDLAVSVSGVESTLAKTSGELNALAKSIQTKTEQDIAKLKTEIDDTVTSAVDDLTKIAAATAVCSAKGQQVDQKTGKCVNYSGIAFAVVSDVDKLPKCTKEIEGQVSLTTRRGLMRCVAGKWKLGTIDPLGTARNPVKDCAEAKAEFWIKDVTPNLDSFYGMDGKGGSIPIYCNMVTGKKGESGKTKASAGKSCKALLDVGVKESGMYWIDPDGGGPFEVYCEQVQGGGGWILLQHNKYGGGNNPCGNRAGYRQDWNAWVNTGIGNLNALSGNVVKSDKCYFMPFKYWGRIVGFSNSAGVVGMMKLVGDTGFSNALTMDDFYVSTKYGLRMSNYPEIKAKMCNNEDNCFAHPDIGFSSRDKDHDIYSDHCARCGHYDCQAWWYARCYHHNQFKGGMSQDVYGACQGSSRGKHNNCNTQHWSWLVR